MNDDVLVLDPDRAQVRRLQHILFDLGATVAIAHNGGDAARYVENKGAPKALVMNLDLPDQDGIQLLTWLRGQASAELCAAVVLSTYTGPMSAAHKVRDELGIAAIVSAKASAAVITDLLKRTLVLQDVKRGQLRKAQETAKAIEAARAADAAKSPMVLQPPNSLIQRARSNEAKRLARIAAVGLAKDLPVEEALQKLVKDLGRAFDASVALVSMALDGRSWFKAGLSTSPDAGRVRTVARDWMFCAELAAEAVPLVVQDAREHPRLKNQPLVVQGALGSLVAVGMVNSDGETLGVLCLADPKPRRVSPDEVEQLNAVAYRLAGEAEMLHQMHLLKQDLSSQWDDAMAREERMDMLRAVLENLVEGVLLHDNRRQILMANRRLADMTGLMTLHIEGSSFEDFTRDLVGLFDEPEEFLQKVRPDAEGPYEIQCVVETQRPKRQVLRWTARPIELSHEWYELLTVADITNETDLEAQREGLVTKDPLTGLLNRRAAEEEGAREAERCRRQAKPYAVLLCEVDGLKSINSSHGLAAGDEALKAVAGVIQKSLRLTDRPARWGGHSFLVLLPDTPEAPARMVAERIRSAMGSLDFDFKVSISGGLVFGQGDSAFSALVEDAEKRLALAAASGGNSIQ
jgi:diguanylate cyclase (GGDEF)-like protein/PAS domain S-box-containing protein